MSEPKDPAARPERMKAGAAPSPEPLPHQARSRVEDRHGNAINTGDEVEIVYGGEYHRMTVDRIDPARTSLGVASEHHVIEGRITVRVHAASILKIHHDTSKGGR